MKSPQLSRTGTYVAALEQDYKERLTWSSNDESRLEYLSDNVFNFVTYDSEISELFVRKALEVCAQLSARTTYEYIKDATNYQWYLLMCNMQFFSDRMEWGSSVRGAWWHYEQELEVATLPDKSFSEEEWLDFIEALIEFSKT